MVRRIIRKGDEPQLSASPQQQQIRLTRSRAAEVQASHKATAVKRKAPDCKSSRSNDSSSGSEDEAENESDDSSVGESDCSSSESESESESASDSDDVDESECSDMETATSKSKPTVSKTRNLFSKLRKSKFLKSSATAALLATSQYKDSTTKDDLATIIPGFPTQGPLWIIEGPQKKTPRAKQPGTAETLGFAALLGGSESQSSMNARAETYTAIQNYLLKSEQEARKEWIKPTVLELADAIKSTCLKKNTTHGDDVLKVLLVERNFDHEDSGVVLKELMETNVFAELRPFVYRQEDNLYLRDAAANLLEHYLPSQSSKNKGVWHEDLYRLTQREISKDKPVVIVAPKFEGTKSTVFCDLVDGIPSTVPLVLVLFAAGGLHSLKSIPRHLYTRLHCVHVQPFPCKISLLHIWQQKVLTCETPLMIGKSSLAYLSSKYVTDNHSLSQITSALRYLYLERCASCPMAILLHPTMTVEEKVEFLDLKAATQVYQNLPSIKNEPKPTQKYAKSTVASKATEFYASYLKRVALARIAQLWVSYFETNVEDKVLACYNIKSYDSAQMLEDISMQSIFAKMSSLNIERCLQVAIKTATLASNVFKDLMSVCNLLRKEHDSLQDYAFRLNQANESLQDLAKKKLTFEPSEELKEIEKKDHTVVVSRKMDAKRLLQEKNKNLAKLAATQMSMRKSKSIGVVSGAVSGSPEERSCKQMLLDYVSMWKENIRVWSEQASSAPGHEAMVVDDPVLLKTRLGGCFARETHEVALKSSYDVGTTYRSIYNSVNERKIASTTRAPKVSLDSVFDEVHEEWAISERTSALSQRQRERQEQKHYVRYLRAISDLEATGLLRVTSRKISHAQLNHH